MSYHDDNQFDFDAFDWEVGKILREHETTRDIEMAHAKLDKALMTYLEDTGQEKVAILYRSAIQDVGLIRLLL